MRNKPFCPASRITVFAAVMFVSATVFATKLIPIARDQGDPRLAIPPADASGHGPLIQPVNDGPGGIQLPIAVPEPTTWGMLVLGAGLLAGVRRFRRK
jgi:hypothetical protein